MLSFIQRHICGCIGTFGEPVREVEEIVKAPKEEASPASSRSFSESLVDTEKLIKQSGPLTVAGRYISSRPLERDIEFEPKAVLGRGMCGDVRLGKCRASGRRYAIKSLNKERLTAKTRRFAKAEAEVYLQLDHPHIARLERIYETQAALHFVMEPLQGGEVYDRIVKRPFSEKQAATALRQMLAALSYLHEHRFVHRDVKPENFLYECAESDFLKLIDFGFSQRLREGARLHSCCGTLQYSAPEVLAQSYTEKADMWSIGIVTYVMLCGTYPWAANNDSEMQKCVEAGTSALYFSRSRFEPLSTGAKHLIKSLLSDSDSRPSAAEVLQNPWIRGQICVGVAPGLDTGVVERIRTYAQAPLLYRAYWAFLNRTSSSPLHFTNDRGPLREQFLALAAEGRGTIGRDELEEALGSTCGDFSADDFIEAVFAGLDLDSSGEISFSEFLAAASFDPAEPCGASFGPFDSIEAETICELLGGDQLAKKEEQALDLGFRVAAETDASTATSAETHQGQLSLIDPATPPKDLVCERLSSAVKCIIPQSQNIDVAAVLGLFDDFVPGM